MTFDYASGNQPPRNQTTNFDLSDQNHSLWQGIWKICATENCKNEHPENFHQKDSKVNSNFH